MHSDPLLAMWSRGSISHASTHQAATRLLWLLHSLHPFPPSPQPLAHTAPALRPLTHCCCSPLLQLPHFGHCLSVLHFPFLLHFAHWDQSWSPSLPSMHPQSCLHPPAQHCFFHSPLKSLFYSCWHFSLEPPTALSLQLTQRKTFNKCELFLAETQE